MQRTNIYLDDEQIAWLDRAASAEKVSRAELIRHIIDEKRDERERRREEGLAALAAAAGIWADRPDGDFESEAERGERAAKRNQHIDRLWTAPLDEQYGRWEDEE